MARGASGSVTGCYEDLLGGDEAAIERIWKRFSPLLLNVARRKLRGRVRASDADDAVQSAFVSFWNRVKQGGLEENLDRNDLRRILCTITVRKALKKVAAERAVKRGGGQVQSLAFEAAVGRLEEPDCELMVDELIQVLPEDARVVCMLRLIGYKNREIAGQLGCTERKIERKLQLIRALWQHELE